MRIYTDFKIALNEIKRDLAEMGIDVHPQTMQDKFVANDEAFATKELQNYIYTVVDACDSLSQLNPVQPWADYEFLERINGQQQNPGTAWRYRDEVWNEFLHDGKFSYSYGERIGDQISTLANELMIHPDSRQIYLSIWNPELDPYRIGGKQRVPCSLGYLFQVRGGKLHITYFMRSCDFATHMQNDMYLATKLMKYMSDLIDVKPGNFTHFIGSLHIYKKDTEGVF